MCAIKKVEGYELLHYSGRICVPKTLQPRVLDWYHCMLRHPGKARLKEAIAAIFHWDSLPSDVEKSCRLCEICQFCKKASKRKNGKATAKKAEQIRWNQFMLHLPQLELSNLLILVKRVILTKCLIPVL